MARTFRKRVGWEWWPNLFGDTPEWRKHRDACPRHCVCHAGARKHRRLTRKVARQQVRRLLRRGAYVEAAFARLPAAYY